MKKFRSVIVLFVLLMMAIIQTNVKAESIHAKLSSLADTTKIFPDTSTWVLTKILGTKSTKQHTGAKIFVMIDASQKKVSGYTACNFIKGSIFIKDSTISIKSVTGGDRICDEHTMEVEKIFLAIFQKSTSWKIVNNMLYLYDEGTLMLEFKSASEK